MPLPIPWRRFQSRAPGTRTALRGVGLRAFSALPLLLAFSFLSAPYSQAQRKSTLPRPRQLDQGITWHRDPATGELGVISRSGISSTPNSSSIHIVTQMVPLTCSVYTADGIAVPGLDRANFRIYEDGIEQKISYFDASSSPASVALIIDASPSVLRDSDEMKRAANALVENLAPLDEAAVADFSAHTYLQIPFSDVRELVRRAVARIDVRQLLSDTGGSNIYEAVYLAARELFPGRKGRKAIVLLTDGQDSGLDLRLEPASAYPQAGMADNRLTFDDVSRILTTEDIQLFVVSTENRPKVMTPDWLEAHRSATLLTSDARRWAIPAYTLYLAEIARRTGGQLYFLRESATMADAFRRVAQKIRAEYTLGYYPMESATPNHAGWHQLKVEIVGPADVSVVHRAAYYVSSQ